jgi:hypothetical protein
MSEIHEYSPEVQNTSEQHRAPESEWEALRRTIASAWIAAATKMQAIRE